MSWIGDSEIKVVRRNEVEPPFGSSHAMLSMFLPSPEVLVDAEYIPSFSARFVVGSEPTPVAAKDGTIRATEVWVTDTSQASWIHLICEGRQAERCGQAIVGQTLALFHGRMWRGKAYAGNESSTFLL